MREGFGPTVTEAMWKSAAVIGGRADGIRHQIEDTASWLTWSTRRPSGSSSSLRNPKLRRHLGAQAREAVRARFLMTRLMEDWLDLLGSFEASFRLKGGTAA